MYAYEENEGYIRYLKCTTWTMIQHDKLIKVKFPSRGAVIHGAVQHRNFPKNLVTSVSLFQTTSLKSKTRKAVSKRHS